MFALLLAAMQIIGQPAEATITAEQGGKPQVLVAEAAWDEQMPEPGHAVRLRVRGEALAELQLAGSDWELMADGKDVAVKVLWPGLTPAPEVYTLEYTVQPANSDGTLVATIDRGANLQPLDTLSIELSGLSMLSKATVYASDDKVAFVACSEPQLIYQRITNGNIIRIATLSCNPGDRRYLKLIIATPDGSMLTAVEGWSTPEDNSPYYEVPVNFGAPLSDLASGMQLLPLELGNDNLPLRKLRLTAEEQSEPLLVRVVRLSSSGDVVRTPVEAVWCEELTLGRLSRVQDTILFQDLVRDGATWAVSPFNGHPIEFNSIKAWAAEVYVACEVPETGQLRLVFHEARREGTTSGELLSDKDVDGLPVAGEFSVLSAPTQSEVAQGFVDTIIMQAQTYTSQWKYTLLYGIPGLILLVVGFVILRQPRTSDYGTPR